MQKKSLLILLIGILLIALMAISFACAVPQEPKKEEPIYYQDQPYEMVYQENGYTYRLKLDGAGVGTMYKSASSVQQFNRIYATSLNGNQIYFTFNGNETRYLYALPDKTLVKESDYEKAPANAVITADLELFTEYQYKYTTTSDNQTVHCVDYITFSREDNGLSLVVDVRKEMIMNEYEYAKGSYEIQDNSKIKLEMDVDFPPSDTFKSHEIARNITTTEEWIANQSDNNGLVSLIETQVNRKYVQLYDDGTFRFIYNNVSSPDTNLTQGFRGKTFVQKIITYTNTGDRYSYLMELKFPLEEIGAISYQIKDCKLLRYYEISEDEETGDTVLKQIRYEAGVVASLRGSHPEYGTSNNFSFANNGNIYISYDEKYYDFTLDNLTIEDYENFKYMILENDTAKFGIYLLDEEKLVDVKEDLKDPENPKKYVVFAKDRELLKIYLRNDLLWQWDVNNIVAP